MSNEIVPATPAGPLEIPEYAQKYLANKDGYAQDVGDINVQDIGLNFCKLVHGTSKESKPGWNGPGSVPLAQGVMILSRDHTVIPVGSIIVPLLRKTRYIKWEGKPSEGRMLDQCESEKDPKIIRDNGLAWGKDEKTGEPIPPRWTKYVNFWVISKYNPHEPAILSFHRTSISVARQWTRELLRATQTWKLPLFLFTYKLMEPIWLTKGKNSWPQFTVTAHGLVNKDKLPAVERAYKTALDLYYATSDQTQVDNEVPPEDAAVADSAPDAGDSSGLALAAAIQQAEQERDAAPPPAAPQVAPKAPPVAPVPTTTVNVPPAAPVASPATAPASPTQAAAPEQPSDTLWG